MEKPKNPKWTGAAFLAYSCTLALGTLAIIINTTMIPVAHAFGVDVAQASLLVSCYGVGRVLTQGLAGALTDRVGRKRVFLAGQLVMTLFFITMPLSPSFLCSACLCVMAGMGYGMLNTSSMAVVYDCFAPLRKNAIAQSCIQFIFASGGIITPFIANNLLKNGLFWGALYWFWAAYMLFMLVLACRAEFPPSFVKSARESGFLQKPKLLREGIILSAVTFCFYGSNIMSITWLPLLAVERIAYSEAQSLLVLSLYNIGSILGASCFLLLSRRIHNRFFLAANPSLAAVALALCVFAQGQLLFLSGVTLAGAALGVSFNIAIGFGGELFSDKAGTITGMVATASSVSTLATPIIARLILNAAGLRSAFALTFVYGAIALALALSLILRYRTLKSRPG